jgi:hypothetical protein
MKMLSLFKFKCFLLTEFAVFNWLKYCLKAEKREVPLFVFWQISPIQFFSLSKIEKIQVVFWSMLTPFFFYKFLQTLCLAISG